MSTSQHSGFKLPGGAHRAAGRLTRLTSPASAVWSCELVPNRPVSKPYTPIRACERDGSSLHQLPGRVSMAGMWPPPHTYLTPAACSKLWCSSLRSCPGAACHAPPALPGCHQGLPMREVTQSQGKVRRLVGATMR